MNGIKLRFSTMLANCGNTLLAAVFYLQTKDKNRADYVWSKDEELQHLVKVSERFAIQTKELVKALKEKVDKREDTQQDWRDFYDSERDMRFYLKQLICFSVDGAGK